MVSSRPEFRELGRVKVSDTVDIVLSEIYKDGKLTEYNINRFINTDGYSGFTKGQEIPPCLLVLFLQLFPQEELTEASETKGKDNPHDGGRAG